MNPIPNPKNYDELKEIAVSQHTEGSPREMRELFDQAFNLGVAYGYSVGLTENSKSRAAVKK